MANEIEYELPFTGQEVEERLIKAGDAVLFTKQTLTDAQKAQARENIGAVAPGEGGGSTSFGREHAGKLVYIDASGRLVPLALGEGLAIVNGVLTIDGGVVENVEALLSLDGYVLQDSNGFYIKDKEVA